LFYRLNVVRIHIPPLRERREDVRILAEFFLQRQSSRRRGPQMRFTDDALDILDHHKEVSRVLGDISKKLERPLP
jgi:DNA-binding NtrC family response regulator